MAANLTRWESWPRIVQAVPTDRPVSIAEVANKVGVSVSTARCAMIDAVDRLELEMYKRGHGTSGKLKKLYFRRYVEGETRPLYQPQPGVDIKPLASCWGGYTYTKGVQHVIGQ